MWIELSDEIELCFDKITDPMQLEALAINALFDSMLKGQHIIFASRKLLKRIFEQEYISPANKKLICWILQKYIYVYECRGMVICKIKVSMDTDICFTDNIFAVPLESFFDLRETKLLTENESDGILFLCIYNFICKQKNVSSVFDVKFENDACHGGNVASKLKQVAMDKRISLCILDSDREMKGAGAGATYKGAKNVYNKFKDSHVMFLHALDIREKENLFSPNLYMLVSELPLLAVLNKVCDDEKVIKYFDVKSGIKLKKYQDTFWKEYYSSVIDLLSAEGIIDFPEKENDLEYVCVEGIGDKLCDVMCKILLQEDTICKNTIKERGLSDEKAEEILGARKSLHKLLPEYLYEEWEQLYTVLFSWGCCISKKFLPQYRI